MSESFPIRISVWSDYVCPFCYLELPVLDRLAAEFDGRIEVDWLAFELRPEPAQTLDPDGEYLQRTWTESVYPMAAERNMVLRLPPVQPRSRKAFEAAEFARHSGRFGPMHRALFRAFFEEGRDLADTSVLVDIGRSVGLDEGELREALESGRHAAKVLADQQLAREIGVSAVPALVLSAGEKGYLVNGAQPYEALRGVLEQAVKAEALAG
jgi:predicted DsbA family dithiol-disulfide isomerase